MKTLDFKTIFSAVQNGNDVRGAVIATETEKVTLTAPIVTCIARAFAGFLKEKYEKDPSELRVGVGHDSRVSAELIKAACCKGLDVTQVYDCSLITTPAMFQSTLLPKSDFDGAVMITASHLPFNRNGLKFFTKDGALSKAELSKILENAVTLAQTYGTADDETQFAVDALPEGGIPAKPFDMRAVYCGHMKEVICREVNAEDHDHPLTGLHIVEDAGNGAAGFFATSKQINSRSSS